MNIITKEQFLRMLTNPAAKESIDGWVEPLNAAMAEWEIGSPQRQAAFLGQVLHESGELQHLVENLSYSATRLRQVWPTRFPDDETAAQYANNPQKLASKVYASRMGNGDESSGDGWKYRGRGLFQLTGRQNYMHCAEALHLDVLNDPDLLAQPLGAARSAAWFWNSRKLNELSDEKPGFDPDAEFVKITKLINGGTIGLQARQASWVLCRRVLLGS